MVYVPNPQDPTQPTTNVDAGYMAAEFQALKGYIQSLVSAGTNFNYSGGLRNRLNNGSFNIAQRGASVVVAAGTSAYTLDQWQVTATGSAVTATQSTGGFNTNGKYLALTQAAGGSGCVLVNKIESYNVQDFVSTTPVVVSGKYYVSNVAAGLPSISLLAATAVDNWAASTVVGASQALGILSPLQTGTWVSFVNYFTLTADATAGLQVNFNFAGGIAAGYTCALDSVQCEKGNLATPFEAIPIQQELARCQRYFQQCYELFAGYSAATAAAIVLGLPVALRAAPAFSAVTTTGSSNITYSLATINTNLSGILLNFAVVATGFYELVVNFSVSAEL